MTITTPKLCDLYSSVCNEIIKNFRDNFKGITLSDTQIIATFDIILDVKKYLRKKKFHDARDCLEEKQGIYINDEFLTSLLSMLLSDLDNLTVDNIDDKVVGFIKSNTKENKE
jgi:predicted methyltransferase